MNELGVVILYTEDQNEPCVPSCLVRVPGDQAEREKFLRSLYLELCEDAEEDDLEYSEVTDFGDFEVTDGRERAMFVTLCSVPG